MSEKIVENDTGIKSKKGFQITVKNLDTDEVIIDKQTRAIIGAFTEDGENGKVNGRGIIITSCKTNELIGAINCADDTVSDAKKRVIGDLPPELLLAAILGDKLK